MSVLDGVLVLEANSLNNPENGFRISFQGLKRPGRGVDHQLHLVPRLKKSRAIPPLSGPSWLVIGWALPLHLPLPRNLRIIFWPFITYAFDKHTGNQKAISWRGLTPLHKYPTVTEPHFCCLSQVTSKHPSPLNTQSCAQWDSGGCVLFCKRKAICFNVINTEGRLQRATTRICTSTVPLLRALHLMTVHMFL